MQEGSTQEDHVTRTSSLLLTWPSPFRYYAGHDGGPSSATTSGAAISNNSYANCAASCTSSGYGPPLCSHSRAAVNADRNRGASSSDAKSCA